MQAGMNTIRESLSDDHAQEHSCDVFLGFHQGHARAGIFRFALSDRDEQIPVDICNVFCRMEVF